MLDSSNAKPLVFCPLGYEMKSLRAGLSDRFDFLCTGPGGKRTIAAFNDVNIHDRPAVILAGLAGALTEHHRAGSAAIIREVIDPTTRERWNPTLVMKALPGTSVCSVTSAETILETAEARKRLHVETGADLVDLESVAFARVANKAGLRWAIVRGISDDPLTGIIPNAAAMVDASGRTRLGPALAQVFRHPRTLPAFLQLKRKSGAALGEVRILLGKSTFEGIETAG